MLKFLVNAVRQIQSGNFDAAIHTLENAVDRTNGCIERGAVDGNGQGRDWLIDCDVQEAVYDKLTCAILPLTS